LSLCTSSRGAENPQRPGRDRVWTHPPERLEGLFFELLRLVTAFSRKFDYEDVHIGVSDERMGYETDEASERRKE
jgi:hypothetical protein